MKKVDPPYTCLGLSWLPHSQKAGAATDQQMCGSADVATGLGLGLGIGLELG